MISEKTIESVALLAKAVNDKAKVLSAVEGSPLDFVAHSGYRVPINVEQLNEAQLIEHYEEAIRTPLVLNVAPSLVSEASGIIPVQEHEETLVAVLKELTHMTNHIIDRARNVAQPFILKICESTSEIPNRADSFKSMYDIRFVEHFGGWKSQWVERVLGQYNVGNGDRFEPITITLPKVPESSFVDDELSTGNVEVDDLMKSYLSSKGIREVNVFDKLGNGTIPAPVAGEAPEYFDYVMFTIILLTAFADEPWAECGMSLHDYTTTVLETLTKLNAWVNDYLDVIGEEYDAKILIRSIGMVDAVKVVYLNPLSYTSFIDAGGDIRSIYGMLLLIDSGDKDKYYAEYDAILERSQFFNECWENKITVDRTRDSHIWIEAIRRNMKQAFAIELSSAGDKVFNSPEEYEELTVKFNELVDSEVNIHNANELATVLMDILKRTAFEGELVIEVLQLIDSYIKDGLEAEQAQTQAIIDICFDYLISNLVVGS